MATAALAQPLLSRKHPAPLALIVDDAAFMSGTAQVPLLQSALAVSRVLTADTAWGLFTTSGEMVAFGEGANTLAALLHGYSVPVGKPSYSPAIFNQASVSLKQRSGVAPNLVLVADNGTLSGYPGLPALRDGLDKEGVQLLVMASHKDSRPAFIAAADMPHLAASGSEARVLVGVANTSADRVGGELLVVHDGIHTVARTQVNLQAQSLSWQEMRIKPPDGVNKYEIVLRTSGKHDMDDRVPWELAVYPRQNAVLLASSANSDPGYAQKALQASPLIGTVALVEPESLDVPGLRRLLSTSKVAVMDGVDAAAFDAGLASEMKSWVEAGGTLVFSAGPKVNDAWNKSLLAPMLPAAIRLKKDNPLAGVDVSDSPVTRNLELKDLPIAISQWMAVDRPSKEQVLMSVGGQPMLISKKAAKGVVLFWASTTDPRWSNWARYPSFPVFWSNVVEFAVSGDVRPATGSTDNTRSLWRAAPAPASNEKIYYVNYAEGQPIDVPADVKAQISRTASSYHDYRWAFLVGSILVAMAYLSYDGLLKKRAQP
ncbi:MAG: hypothetical protein HYX87_03585 [Chloroflexi bacterium]|nr:hypothetical protein [Chloroflexota bacterium]